MDADYLKSTLGQVVARGCADTIAVAPVDPIHYLSLWLFKYVENAKLVMDFQREKDSRQQEQRVRHDRKTQQDIERTEELQKKESKINQLRSIQKDPYLLFDECLKAVLQFTGGESAYVALVLDKIWEPPKKSPDSEGGESAPNEEEPAVEEEEEKEEEGFSKEANFVKEGVDGQEEGGAEKLGGENPKKNKPLKPPNYRNKILLYVATTPKNEHLINKQLDRKSGPISFSILFKGLPKLHIANVLYQEGVHFFQGVPLMGAYLSFPISLNLTPVQAIALLCVDTLRKEHAGTGRPFSLEEQEFIGDVARAATEALTTILPAASDTFNTKSIMKDLQDQLQQLEVSHKAELKKREARQISGNDETQGETKKDEDKVKEGEVSNQVDETESKDLENIKDDDADADIAEQDGMEECTEESKEEDPKEEDREDPEEHECQEEADDDHDDVDVNQKQMQKVGKFLKQQQRKVARLQKHFQKCETRLEKQAAKVFKLEKQLSRSNGLLSHFSSLLTCVLETIVKHKDEVFGQIKQCLFPTAVVYRVLKALLYILGQSDAIIHDWTRSRQVLNEDICMAMKQFGLSSEMDLKKWDLSDAYLDGITEEKLSRETPVGYLGQQWLLAAKKVAFEAVKHNKCKTKNEEAAKAFADAELEQMVAEIDLRVAADEEKKLSLHLEDLQSNFAKHLASSLPDEVAVVDEDEAIEEE